MLYSCTHMATVGVKGLTWTDTQHRAVSQQRTVLCCRRVGGGAWQVQGHSDWPWHDLHRTRRILITSHLTVMPKPRPGPNASPKRPIILPLNSCGSSDWLSTPPFAWLLPCTVTRAVATSVYPWVTHLAVMLLFFFLLTVTVSTPQSVIVSPLTKTDDTCAADTFPARCCCDCTAMAEPRGV